MCTVVEPVLLLQSRDSLKRYDAMRPGKTEAVVGQSQGEHIGANTVVLIQIIVV